MSKYRLFLCVLLFSNLFRAAHSTGIAAGDNWPQAAGPNQNWTVSTDNAVPSKWSVEHDENIAWRVSLSETGQSGIAVWDDRLFLSTMKPLERNNKSKKGSDIVVMCVSARSGKTLWQHDLPGNPKAQSIYAYGFSSSSSPTPITDGKHVWFWNASGNMGCWTIDGKEVWTRQWTPTLGRPFNKQYEPIKIGNTILNVEPLELNHPKRREDAWNYIRGFDAQNGTLQWTAFEGLTHYNTPVLGKLPQGGYAVLSGRGAHHGTPEAPAGMTLTRVDGPKAGEPIWSWQAAKGGKAQVTQCWDEKYSYWLDETRTDLVVVDTMTGKLAKTISWTKGVTVTKYNSDTQEFSTRTGVDLSQEDGAIQVFPAWHANVSIYPHMYFQCFDFKGKRRNKPTNIGPRRSLCRINVESGAVEYLQIPFETPAVEGQQLVQHELRYPRMTINSRGIDVASDKRSQRSGWWWCFNGNVIAVNDLLYFTFMCGRVQVINGKVDRFDQRALVSQNDLGKFGETWSCNTPSYANGRLYHRTMKELICISAE